MKPAPARFTCVGRFIIRTEWLGGILVYDVLMSSGQLVAVGIDALSANEEIAMASIVSRLFGGRKAA